jgi:hypothetical protein
MVGMLQKRSLLVFGILWQSILLFKEGITGGAMSSEYSVYIGEVLIINNKQIETPKIIDYCFNCNQEISSKYCQDCGTKAQFKNIIEKIDINIYEILEKAGVKEDEYQVIKAEFKIYLIPNSGNNVFLDSYSTADFKEMDNTQKDWLKISEYLKKTDMEWELKTGILGEWG